jgi:hypothetical protein
MVFRKGWIRRGRIYSDEGFSVSIEDKTHLVYRESNKNMTISGEMLINGFVLYVLGMVSWDDGAPCDLDDRFRIVENIRRALESQGMSLQVDQS